MANFDDTMKFELDKDENDQPGQGNYLAGMRGYGRKGI